MRINKNYIRVSLANNGINIDDVKDVIVERNTVTAYDKHNEAVYSRDLTKGVIDCNSYHRTLKQKEKS